MENIEHKGYRIEVRAVGRGFRASIYPPGATKALPDSPASLVEIPMQSIVDEAKSIIDARLE